MKPSFLHKNVFIFFIVAALIFSFCSVAFALDRDWTVGRSFSWSPFIDGIDFSEGLSHYLFTDTDFHFDQTGADQNNSAYYFTFEHNNGADGLDGDSQYSTIPDPHFDWDDDNGDTWEEESEVSIEADSYKDPLIANYNYYFITWWINRKSTAHPGGTLYYVAQRSIYNPLNGEYEALHYDLLTTRQYPQIPPY